MAMPLEVLSRYDEKTASAILAAAALSTSAMPSEKEDDLVLEHKDQVVELLAEIRRRLRLRVDDQSPTAKASIDNFISNSIDEVVLTAPTAQAALNRAGQAGRLSPGLYKVEQPSSFVELFYPLTMKKHIVQDVVNYPDDFQHLLNDIATPGDRDNLSLFLKQVPPRNTGQAHWILVQTVRQETRQIVQSAWRIFGSDVDLSHASEPIHVLKQFAAVFGLPVRVGDEVSTFIESRSVLKDSEVNVGYEGPRTDHEVYWSYSFRGLTSNPRISKIGIAYCIDISRYKAALRRHGFVVR
jgi:hypothetical protein